MLGGAGARRLVRAPRSRSGRAASVNSVNVAFAPLARQYTDDRLPHYCNEGLGRGGQGLLSQGGRVGLRAPVSMRAPNARDATPEKELSPALLKVVDMATAAR